MHIGNCQYGTENCHAEIALRISYTVTRHEELVERINKEMVQRGYDQGDLARLSGVNTSSISRLVSGKREVAPESLKAIGAVLGISTLELAYYIGLADEMPRPRQSASDRFIAAWDKAPDKAREQILAIIKILSQQ